MPSDENNNQSDITVTIEQLEISKSDNTDKQENLDIEKKDMNVVKWLVSIASYNNFDLMMRFMSTEILNLIVSILTHHSDNDEAINNIISNYSKYIK
jgi:hypothetical protein